MITYLLSSSRENGNTHQAMKILTSGISNRELRVYDLYRLNIEKVNDIRHVEVRNINQHNDDYDNILESVVKSETVILSTPLYWYSMSASLKLFIDRWTESMRDEKIGDFKKIMSSKRYIVLIIGGDNPEKKSIPLQEQFKYIFDFIGIDNYEFIIGNANTPNDFRIIEQSFIDRLEMINKELKEVNK